MTPPSTDLLELMLRARRFDEALLGVAGEIDGHYHVSHGLEASAAALAAVRLPGDLIATNYRSHAHLICLGRDPEVMLAEVLGRPVAPQLGRSGSIHLCAPELGVLYTSAMVAGGLPHAVGYGLALKRRREGSVGFCLFGDGAVQEGVFAECANLAAIWELPVMFICENNAARVSGRTNAYQAATALTALAAVHDVEAESVDGRDARATTRALRDLVAVTRSDARPRFLEVRSAPWRGNATFYPTDVTGPTDVTLAATPTGDDWYDHDDPILNEARALLADDLPVEQVAAAQRRVDDDLAGLADRACALPTEDLPSRAIALGDVWSETP
jgi:TPP-dependent pyruvate/acetoin dehydrogenase alpha subunit